MNRRILLLKKIVILGLLLGATLCCTQNALAQAKQTARYELEQKGTDSEYIVISMKEEGLFVIRDLEKYKDGKRIWKLLRLDTTLQEVWNEQLETENNAKLVGYEYRNNLSYILFRLGEHEASELVLYTIHIRSKEIKQYSIKQAVSFRITHFNALAHSITLGGYVQNEPAILLYDLDTEKTKLVPGFFISDTELLDVRVNSNNTFNVVVADRTNKQKMKLVLKTFDAQGALLLEDAIEIDAKRMILSGISSTLLNDDLLITGTWTIGNSKQASGVYTTIVDPFSNQPINYYDFGQLNHFFDYQNPKQAAKLKMRSTKAKQLNEVPDFKAYVIPMRLEEQPLGFGLLSEVYLPTTSINSYPYWANYGTPYYSGYSPYGYNPFMNRYYNSPYQYNNNSQTSETKMLHASLILFDLKGKLQQDYGLKLDDKKLNSLEQASDFIYYKNQIALASKKEKDLRLLVGDLDGTLIADTLHTQLSNPEEIVKSESDSNSFARFWYKNIFYVWGYQNIRHISRKAEESSHYVFYINKIEVH
ncbi:MAG: hypothetical protein IPJ20_24190 [Flammeovirgaceae bacterium]|nr:hypothetical protein [Flammeovirgaceae bacterium]